MKRYIKTALCALVLLTVCAGCIPVAAEAPRKMATSLGSNQIQVVNNTGASITEIYLYPGYSTRVGDARNKGWIRSGESAVVSLTSAEARRDCLWNLTIVFKPQNRSGFKCTWDDLDLSYYLGHAIEVTVADNGGYTFHVIDLSGSIWFDFYNDTGYIFTEVYLYASNSNTWGATRNNKEIRDQGSIRITMNQNESASTVQWNLRILLRQGKSYYTAVFEGVDLWQYSGGEMIVTVDRNGNLRLENSYDYT